MYTINYSLLISGNHFRDLDNDYNNYYDNNTYCYYNYYNNNCNNYYNYNYYNNKLLL